MTTPSPVHPTVYVCTDSNCSATKASKKLIAAITGCASVRKVDCQKVCEPAVCGFALDGLLTWFAGITTAELRDDVAQVVESGLPTKRLRKRIAHDRTGKLRH